MSVFNKLSSLSSEVAISPLFSSIVSIPSGSPGCPKVYISIEFLELLKEAGYTWVEISKLLGTSRSTLWRRLRENGISISSYCDVSDRALDYVVKRYQDRNPNCGEVMLRGYLQSINIIVQRRRIRESLSRVSPLSSMMRCHSPIVRRVYKVPGANSLWHIDGHHKLVR